MADIVLKDRNGNDVTYEGIETVTFDTTAEGVQATFTEGIAMEGLEIAPDFSGGDMPIAAPDGMLVKSATVKKPDTLTPENVRNGVEIGGVTGTLPVFDILENLPVALDFSGGNQPIVAPEGKAVKSAIIQRPENLLPENIAGGVDIAGIIGTLVAGGNVKVASGTYNGNGATTQTISHNLGEIPDVFVIYNPSISAATNNILLGIGVSDAFRTIKSFKYPVDVFYYSNGYKMTVNTTAIDKATSGVMHTATSSTIKIGNSSCKLSSTVYHWLAIGGLT